MDSSDTILLDFAPPPRLLTFRSVGIFMVILVLLWIALSLFHYQQVRRQLRDILTRQAEEMASTLALADRHLDRLLERLHEEQAARLLSIGDRLRDLELREPLTYERLENLALEANVFNIVVFNNEGVRELGLRGQGPGGGIGGWGGGGVHSAESALEFLKSNEPSRVQGMHRAGRRGESRFSVWVRRPRGGALMINTDVEEQQRMLQELGPEALLREFAGRSGIVFLERRTSEGVIFRVPEKSETAPETFAVEIPAVQAGDPSLFVGFDTAPFRLVERELFQRLILSLLLITVLAVMALIWSRFQRHHGTVAQALHQVRGYHRAVLDHMEDAVLAWNEKEGFTFWNTRAENLFPDIQESKKGKTLPKELLSFVAASSSLKEPVVLNLPAGHEQSRRYRAAVTTLAGMHPTTLFILSDVTAVEQAAREREQREHLQALARVASGVAHEVRNPLNAIDMTIQTLCTEPSFLAEEDRRMLQDLRQEVARINQMVEHFLAYGRPQPPIFSSVDLLHITNDTLHFLTPLCQERKISIRVDSLSSVHLFADAQQLRQVWLNILMNALEASPSDSEIQILLEEKDGNALFQCTDHGSAMTPEQLLHVFEPYYTNKPKGTGLGMSIVKRILSAHGGTIEISSQVGQGTQVRVYLPIKDSGSPRGESNES